VSAGAGSWSTQQLVEFLALVSSFTDAASATHGAVERAAEAVDAEVVALVRDGIVAAAVGFPGAGLPADELVALAMLGATASHAVLPGVGACRVIVVALAGEVPAQLLVARAGEEDFSAEERDLLRGMARVLVLTLRMLARQQLLECLSELQRMIVRRAEPRELLQTVVDGTAALIGDDVASLQLLDPQQPETGVLVASIGFDDALHAQVERRRIGEGLGGRAIAEDRLVVFGAGADDVRAVPATPDGGVQAAMAAPVREEGRAVGSLVVASRRAGRRYTSEDEEILLAFAEHASLALTDAKMVATTLHQAFHDPLTDLPNRALFADRLDHALRRTQRSGEMLAVLFLDIDRFKIVNDSMGHAAGDELLREVGARLLASIRPGDTAARFGGDEFAILLEDIASCEDAENVAVRIMHALGSPLRVAERDVYVTVSIGISMEAATSDDAIRDADLAMYRAKAQGKGRFAIFEPDMHAAVVERAGLEADLQRVVERDELMLHYQPIIALDSSAIVGVEALVRWCHPERGLVPPNAFIPLAEEIQLMPEIGRWILNAACHQGAIWQRERPLRIAVNISVCQLAAARLVGDVASALAISGLSPSSLVLEITETALMRDVEETIACLTELKALGVLLAVDDFGTGYSSLDYLRRFPIDILKIDKAFIDDLAAGDAKLARVIIDLGESFDLEVVAEGIEHEEQHRRLLELGCRLGQGFRFARPMPAPELSAALTLEDVFAARCQLTS
jgi:diguanylate cyclase (GGDEF)-like protein